MSSAIPPASDSFDANRRHFLLLATSAIGMAGVAASSIPFLASWRPSARARALGAPVEVDIGKLDLGAMMQVLWRGQPIYIVHRTPQMLASLTRDTNLLRDPQSNDSQQPDYAKNTDRAIRPEYLVVIGVCTHLGCAPTPKFEPDGDTGKNWPGGFYCACHGSKYDIAGRVFKDVPAPRNLAVPPYRFADDTHVIVGVDTETSSA